MDDRFYRALVRVAATCAVAMLAVVCVRVILRSLARDMTSFVASPGGLIVVVLIWRAIARARK